MEKILALCDYNDKFGEKYYSNPYRSGMDKQLLKNAFMDNGFDLTYTHLSNPRLFDSIEIQPIIYTSQEDPGYKYKSFIEDIVLGLSLLGHQMLPDYEYLRANNNKVFMEILRKQKLPSKYHCLTNVYGCLEDLEKNITQVEFPCVVKTAGGAGSSGVFLALDKKELFQKVKRISRTRYTKDELKDTIRIYKHTGYQRESRYRSKYIVQKFIPGLTNDWKILIYYDKYYVLRRSNRVGDFRASGSGKFSYDEDVDERLLDSAFEIFKAFDVPMISLDLAMSNNEVILLEMQFVQFGTSTLDNSPYYYTKENSKWQKVAIQSILEEEFARSIVKYLHNRNT